MQKGAASRSWLDHLTTSDLEILVRAVPEAGMDASQVRANPGALERLMTDPAAYDDAFGRPADDREVLLAASPFLVFALIVHRGWVDLRTTASVDEWFGHRRRLPVLSGPQLQEFLSDSGRRLFMTELLDSYTRVASGTTWVRTANRWRRRRFSELDPLHLASLLEVVAETERPGVYRRLGDLALFLTGVFPDHTEAHGLQPRHIERLVRLTAPVGTKPPDLSTATPVSMLEDLGQHWYRLAAKTAAGPLAATMAIVAEVGDQFQLARRALNYLSDRFLFDHRQRWSGDLSA